MFVRTGAATWDLEARPSVARTSSIALLVSDMMSKRSRVCRACPAYLATTRELEPGTAHASTSRIAPWTNRGCFSIRFKIVFNSMKGDAVVLEAAHRLASTERACHLLHRSVHARRMSSAVLAVNPGIRRACTLLWRR